MSNAELVAGGANKWDISPGTAQNPRDTAKAVVRPTLGKSRSSASGAAMVEDFVPCDPNKSEVYLVSSPGFGIIDSGCGKTLIGQSTLNALFRKYAEIRHPLPELRREEHLFRFLESE